jgi:hypothetical protein
LKRTLRRIATDLLTSSPARYLALALDLLGYAVSYYAHRLTGRRLPS